MRDNDVIHSTIMDVSALRSDIRRVCGRVFLLFIVLVIGAYAGGHTTEVAGQTAAGTLNQVKVEAEGRGIPTKVLDDIGSDPDFKIKGKDYSGEKTAGYSPSDSTMGISGKVMDQDGNVIPQQARDPSQVMEDVFHEGFHHKWKTDNMANNQDMKKLAGKAKEQFEEEHGIELNDGQAMEVVEEAIGVKFGKLVGGAHIRSRALEDTAYRQTSEGADPKDVNEGVNRNKERIENVLKKTLNDPGMAYCNDYEKSINFDIEESGKKYIQDELLGVPIEVFISRVQRWSVVRAKQRTSCSGWDSMKYESGAKSFQNVLGHQGLGNTPETPEEQGKRQLEHHEMQKMGPIPGSPGKCPGAK